MDERRTTTRSRSVVRRRRFVAIGGLALLAAVVIGVVWADQSTAGRQEVTTTTSEQAETTLPADVHEQATTTTEDDSGLTQSTTTTKVTTPAAPATSAERSAVPAKDPTVKVRVWFVKNERLVSVTKTIPATRAVGAAALNLLFSGPTGDDTAAGLVSAIPNGSRLLGLNIKDRVAIVDVSGKFASGGGSTSMYVRLGQLIYTITEFPTVDKVQLRIDGKVVTALGGEGLLIPKAISRSEWAKLIK